MPKMLSPHPSLPLHDSELFPTVLPRLSPGAIPSSLLPPPSLRYCFYGLSSPLPDCYALSPCLDRGSSQILVFVSLVPASGKQGFRDGLVSPVTGPRVSDFEGGQMDRHFALTVGVRTRVAEAVSSFPSVHGVASVVFDPGGRLMQPDSVCFAIVIDRLAQSSSPVNFLGVKFGDHPFRESTATFPMPSLSFTISTAWKPSRFMFEAGFRGNPFTVYDKSVVSSHPLISIAIGLDRTELLYGLQLLDCDLDCRLPIPGSKNQILMDIRDLQSESLQLISVEIPFPAGATERVIDPGDGLGAYGAGFVWKPGLPMSSSGNRGEVPEDEESDS